MTFDATCTFCNIVRGPELAHIVYEDEDSIAFLDFAPAAEGHTLVVPRDHARTLLDISPTSAAALLRSATHVARTIDNAFHPDGMTMVQTNERAGGQTVFHVHLHLVPRWKDDELFRPWRTDRVPIENLEMTRLRMIESSSTD
jgi:histidine triad (HIT) family protein